MHTIKDLMDSTPMWLRMDSSLTEASCGLTQVGTDALPLCDPDGSYLGIVTYVALERALSSMGDLAYSLRAQHLMTTTTPLVSMSSTVDEALALMATHQVEYLPVVEGGVLRGALTSSAIAAAGTPTTTAELPEARTEAPPALDLSAAPGRPGSRANLEAA
ncbi:CBS domain-containing protein [Nesterenkonia sandarakina]|uniref:Putative transcriptional regulator n=1 Tax=Nesterenkonia sandarakina TaxID=272918 RepID=A0A7Z0E5J6_9MICC|nr:CBS domain-containing protein [Nesterenkonia sandarakina]NYJ15483.1 putative transcriptional regulator [Nesterenkonia sandarakina]